jgi:hypothetical protein
MNAKTGTRRDPVAFGIAVGVACLKLGAIIVLWWVLL